MWSPAGDVLGALRLWKDDASWRNGLGLLSAGLLCKLLWDQYGILRHPRLPATRLGWPIFGKTPEVLRETLQDFGRAMMKGCPVVITNFFFANVAMISYPLYLEHMRRLELDGEFTPAWLRSMCTLLGKSSVLALPAGKGHHLHKRLRGKILTSMGPKPCLAMLPKLIQLVRSALDKLAEDTAMHGSTSFQETASSLASKVSSMMVTAGLSDELQSRIEELLDVILSGVISAPLNLGRLNAFGRAMTARKELGVILRGLMDNPNLEKQNIIRDLARASEEGEALSLDEMVDTVFTLLAAGKLTTADALPELVAQLSKHRDWVARVAEEPLEFQSIEEDSATMRVVRECLRIKPPAGAYRRVSQEAIDLGEHGRLPAGTPFAVLIGNALMDMGADFDPDRWTPEATRSDFLAFGGSQPHACVGRYLAILELQVFARMLCREYDFEDLVKACKAFFDWWKGTGFPCTPKFHLALHLTFRSKVQGNPTKYATWLDESFNRKIAILAHGSHATFFEARVLVSFEKLFSNPSSNALEVRQLRGKRRR